MTTSPLEVVVSETQSKAGELHTALATWIFLLDDQGNAPDDEGIAAALAAFREAGEGADVDALGKALVEAVASSLPGDDLATVTGWLGDLFGADKVTTAFGEDRAERTRTARRAQFATNLPWLARVIDRFPGGNVGAHWLLVERVDEQVTCMDPYPWDDLDEEYTQPVVEFMVKWELAGCEGVRWNG
ncbi:MAG: hypothetical protein H6742_21940 [Alphaproteobacteria bacterium]|nr:hypothetical protein [Alphaproteobacteria bacterium]